MKRLPTVTLVIVVICGMLPQEIFCSMDLARWKYAKQSSRQTKSWQNPRRAIDPYINTCISTNATRPGWHWWYVDLLGTYSVRYVNITNRDNCCKGSLQNFRIEVSEEKPTTLPGFPGTTNASVCMTRKDPVPNSGTFKYECNQPVIGRYVRIVQGSPMSPPLPMLICRFQVYGDAPGPPNLALGKPATQSSINHAHRPNGFAKYAVDGIVHGDYPKNTCTHTALYGSWHWWQVDLQNTYNISAVRIFNRQDCCGERLRNFAIEVSEEDPSNLPGFPRITNAAICLIRKDVIPDSGPTLLECDQPVKGRYVRIVKRGYSALTLCEVEVFESLIKPTKAPGEWINRKSPLWRFIYIASQGSMDVLSASSLTRLMIDCARQRIHHDRPNIYNSPYIHVDLHTRTCRFFEYVPHRSAQPRSNWVMYKLE